MASKIQPVWQFGYFGMWGTGMVFCLTFGLLRFWVKKVDAADEQVVDSNPKGKVPAFVLLILLLALIPGIFSLKSDMRAIEYLNPEGNARNTFQLLDEEFGGTNIFLVDIDSGKADGIQRLKFLRYLDKLRQFALKNENVSEVYSYSQLFASLNEFFHGDKVKPGALPEGVTLRFSAHLLNQREFLFQNVLHDQQRQVTTVFIRTADLPSGQYLQCIEEFLAFAEREKPEGVKIIPRQGIYDFLKADKEILNDQLSSLWISVIVIFVFLLILWRSFIFAAAAVLLNAPAVLFIFGVMGYSGIHLNSITVMASTIVLGIAVDDSVHFLTHLKEEMKAVNYSTALNRTIQVKWKPMLCTTVVLFLGFILLTRASFPPVVQLGGLSAGAFVFTLASVLILPGLFRSGKLNENT